MIQSRFAPRHPRPARRGQALVELALVLPIFILLLFGLIEGGRLVFASNAVSQAVREGARLASVQAPFIGATGADCTAPVCPADTAALRTNVLAAANRMTGLLGEIPDGDLDLNVAADSVTVRIDVPIEPILPLFDFFYPDSIEATTTMALA